MWAKRILTTSAIFLGFPLGAFGQQHDARHAAHGQANEHMNQRSLDELAADFDSSERDAGNMWLWRTSSRARL